MAGSHRRSGPSPRHPRAVASPSPASRAVRRAGIDQVDVGDPVARRAFPLGDPRFEIRRIARPERGDRRRVASGSASGSASRRSRRRHRDRRRRRRGVRRRTGARRRRWDVSDAGSSSGRPNNTAPTSSAIDRRGSPRPAPARQAASHDDPARRRRRPARLARHRGPVLEDAIHARRSPSGGLQLRSGATDRRAKRPGTSCPAPRPASSYVAPSTAVMTSAVRSSGESVGHRRADIEPARPDGRVEGARVGVTRDSRRRSARNRSVARRRVVTRSHGSTGRSQSSRPRWSHRRR